MVIHLLLHNVLFGRAPLCNLRDEKQCSLVVDVGTTSESAVL